MTKSLKSTKTKKPQTEEDEIKELVPTDYHQFLPLFNRALLSHHSYNYEISLAKKGLTLLLNFSTQYLRLNYKPTANRLMKISLKNLLEPPSSWLVLPFCLLKKKMASSICVLNTGDWTIEPLRTITTFTWLERPSCNFLRPAFILHLIIKEYTTYSKWSRERRRRLYAKHLIVHYS